jgi:hypothetical protein
MIINRPNESERLWKEVVITQDFPGGIEPGESAGYEVEELSTRPGLGLMEVQSKMPSSQQPVTGQFAQWT